MNYQTTYPTTENQTMQMGMNNSADWSAEVTPLPMTPGRMSGNSTMMGNEVSGSDSMMRNGAQNGLSMPWGGGNLNMQHNLPSDVVEAPTSLGEAYLGSLKATLNANKGNYVVATFLIGTQNLVSWEGILYEVGNDFVTIYQEGRDRYIVIDMYSLKYMEFYDIRRREMCDELLRRNGWPNGMNG